MDIDKLIDSIEKHFREFIAYLLSFFADHETKGIEEQENNELQKTAIFSVMGLIFGAYIWIRHVNNKTATFDDLLGATVDHTLLWISFGVLAGLALKVFRVEFRMVPLCLAIFKVFVVTFVIAAYVAVIGSVLMRWFEEPLAAWLRPTNFDQWQAGRAAAIGGFAHLILVIMFLPRQLKRSGAIVLEQWPRAPDLVFATVAFAFLITTVSYSLDNARGGLLLNQPVKTTSLAPALAKPGG
jgi:hypothetical protein